MNNTIQHHQPCSSPKDVKEVEISNEDFAKQLDWSNRLTVLYTEVLKLAFIFQSAVEYPQSNTFYAVAGLGLYVATAAYQAFTIKDKKDECNKDELLDSQYWFHKYQEPIAKIEPFGKQFKKSLVPGHGLTFLKFPKFN